MTPADAPGEPPASPTLPRIAMPAALPAGAGVGFKPEHYADIRAARPDLGFFEVHAENYMGAGGSPHAQLAALRATTRSRCTASGSRSAAPGRSTARISRGCGALRALCARQLLRAPRLVDATTATILNDLLPLPYTDETLAAVCAHVDEVQEALGRRMLLENPSTYVVFAASTCRDRVPAEIARAHRLRPAARRQQRLRLGEQPPHRSAAPTSPLPARGGRRDPSRRARCRGRCPRGRC